MQLGFFTGLILGFSGFIPAIIGIIRFAQIRNVYRPFIYLIWIGSLADLLGLYFAYTYHNNIVISAIYRLGESLLLLWFFEGLGIFKNGKKVLYFLITVFIIVWLADNFLSSHFDEKLTYYFDIVYSLSVVLLSIRSINDLLFTERTLLKNPTFLICVGLIIYFTYKIIQRMFGLYGLKNSMDFRRSIDSIGMLINFLANLIYAVAVLWMRKRKPFTMRFD